MWCGLIRPDPTPIILAVSLTSGFPRHPDAGPTAPGPDPCHDSIRSPGTPCRRGEVVGRARARARAAPVMTRVAAIKARGRGDPCNQRHCHHCCSQSPTHITTRRSKKTRWRTSACLKWPAPAWVSLERLDPRHGNAPAVNQVRCGHRLAASARVYYTHRRPVSWIDRCCGGGLW